jgi:hypothetical protein
MGASADYEEIELNVSNPRSQSEVKTATRKAWNDLVKERGYEYGHSYSGTFSQKDGVVISYFPELNDEEIKNLATLVSQDIRSQDELRKFIERYDSVWLNPYLSNEKFHLSGYRDSPLLEKRNPQYVAKAKSTTPVKMLKPNPDWRNAIVTIEKFQEKMPMPYNKLTKELADILAEKQGEKRQKYKAIYDEIETLRQKLREGEKANNTTMFSGLPFKYKEMQREIWRLEKSLPHGYDPNYQPTIYGLKNHPRIAELTNSPTYLKMKKMQKSYPRLYGGVKKVGYQSAFKKADISYYNLERMNKQWNDKWGDALAITNGSIVIFMGYCSE